MNRLAHHFPWLAEQLGDGLPDGLRYLLAFLVSFGIALALTPLFRECARRMGIVDKPDPRRINKVPIPRGGGLSIIFAFNITVWLLAWYHGGYVTRSFEMSRLVAFTGCSVVLAVVGLFDDMVGLRPLIKLFGQIAVAVTLYFAGFHFGGVVVSFPPWLDLLVTSFWIVGAINAFNLIDGLDGLASGIALIASLGMMGALFFTGRPVETLPFLAFAGGCLGFLRYNFHPASVFLGDTGSMFLGMSIASLPLLSGTRTELMASLGMPLLVMGVPIFDTFLAIWRRVVRHFLPEGVAAKLQGKEEGVMQPDKDHIHHRLLREAMNNQRHVAIVLYGLTAAFVLLGLGNILLRGRGVGLFFIAFVTATFVIVRNFECIELFDTGKLFTSNTFRPRRYLALPFTILFDAVLLIGVFLVCWFATRTNPVITRGVLLEWMPLFVVPAFVCLAVGKIYRRVWPRAQLRDYVVLGFCLVMGACISIGLVWMLSISHHKLLRFSALFAALSLLALSIVRARRECLTAAVQVFGRNVQRFDKAAERTLIYGGGLRLRGYLRELFRLPGAAHRLIVGIIDDDPLLKGRLIAGYPVLGTGVELEQMIEENHIREVVLTCVMDPAYRAQVVERLHKTGVRIILWSCQETEL